RPSRPTRRSSDLELKATGQSEVLAAAYERSLRDADLDARLALVAALGGQKDARALEALRAAAANDASSVVRERASTALRATGQEAPWAGREPVRRPPLDYRVAMAVYDPRSGKDTGRSQFFITHSPEPHLDGGYTLFGWVAEGMEVVDKVRPGDLIERVEIWTGP